MARSKGSRSGRRASSARGDARPAAKARKDGAGARIRTWGLDPSWFAFRARDGRGLVVQLMALGGLAVGLFAALAMHGPMTIGASDQWAQLAALASIVGLSVVPIASAAATDAQLSSLAARGSISGAALDRSALLLPAVVALGVGLALPLVLFALGGQWLYLGIAGVALAIVIVAATLSYLRTSNGDAGSSGGDGGPTSG